MGQSLENQHVAFYSCITHVTISMANISVGLRTLSENLNDLGQKDCYEDYWPSIITPLGINNDDDYEYYYYDYYVYLKFKL